MAILQDSKGERVVLAPRHLVGRSRSMNTTLRSPEVSAEHAAIAWAGSWTVRDLGSRNGTWVGERRLEPGERVAISAGDELRFGGTAQRWTLVTDGPPSPVAFEGDRVVEGDGEMLALPSPDDPQGVVVHDMAEGWVLMGDEGSLPVRNGDTVTVAGRRWRLVLPEALDPTMEHRSSARSLDDVLLAFKVSADEEYVELTVAIDGDAWPLKPRAHHYVLLTLARARLEDATEDVPEPERGWVYQADLEKMLRATSNQLYVSIHRARRELEALDIIDAALLVERRPTTRQMRIGVGALQVASL